MKKILVILLVVARALSLSSCSSSSSSSSEKTTAKTNDATTKGDKETTVKTTIGTEDTQQTTAKDDSEHYNGDEKPQNFTLQFATIWEAVDFQIKQGHEVWAKDISERVEKEKPHTVTFAWHHRGALLGPTEIYEGVVSGAADLGSTCPSYPMEVFPLTMGLELPEYINDNALVASLTMHEAWERSSDMQKEYDDVKIMFFWATGPEHLLTNEPIRDLEDLSRLQIRAAGVSALAIEALGGTPVSIHMPETYAYLSSGIVDGLRGATDMLKGFRLAEVTKYITKTPFVGALT